MEGKVMTWTKEDVADADKIIKAERLKKAREAKEASAKEEAERERAKAEYIKAAADRAEARSRGESVKDGFTIHEEAEPGDPPHVEAWPDANANGHPSKKSYANALACISALKLKCTHDVFLNVYTVTGHGLRHFAGELTDPLVRQFRDVCIQTFDGYEPGKDASFDALMHECEANQFNSLQDMLLQTEWDGVPRLDHWLTTYCGVTDTTLHQTWGALFLKACVRRAFDPGCKWDHVLVLEGPEGVNKSSLCKVLACGEADRKSVYFSETPILHKQTRDQQELTCGVWIYELAEMAGMKKADQHLVKNFITAEAERARAAYAHLLTKQPRVSCFVGTFNTDANTGELVEYLNPGDRRRWWPVKVGAIDLEAFKRDRLQLLAEAMVRAHEDPEPWFPDEPLMERPWRELRLPPGLWDDAAEVQKEREVTSPLALRLEGLFDRLTKARPGAAGVSAQYSVGDHTWHAGTDWIVSPTDVWVRASMIVELIGRWDPSGRGTAQAMGVNGWTPQRMAGGNRTRGYVHER